VECTQQHGQRFREYAEHQHKHVGIERTRWQDEHYDPRARKGVSMDGGMVYVRGEGWKELKAGVIGNIVNKLPIDEDGLSIDEVVKLTDLKYTAIVGGVEAFGQAMWELAVQHDVLYAGHSAVTADGAAWIWRLTADLFPTSVQIVDWHHATEHLAKASHARYCQDTEAAQSWFKRMKTPLYRGEIWKITADLERAKLEDQARYFQNHHRRMQYQDFRAEGYPIGSGAVESGIKQYKERLTGPGMRWSRPGAEKMFVLRSAVLGDDFDELWDVA
jgi:hypothetical protein